MFLYLIVVLTLVKTCTLSTSPGAEEYQTKLETLEVKQELLLTASKLLHEDMLLIQRAMQNYHLLNMDQFKNFSNGLQSSSLLHNNITKAGMDSLHTLLTNIAQQQEYQKTQIQRLSSTFISNMTMMVSSLREIETELTDVLSNQRELENKIEKINNATSTCQNAPKECPGGWKGHQNLCFFLARERMSWTEAKEYCRVRNSSLATISTEDVSSFISDEIRTLSQESGGFIGDTWIGLNNLMTSGTWVWDTLSGDVRMAYTNWGPSQSSGRGECVVISSDYRWYSVHCNGHRYLLCELSLS